VEKVFRTDDLPPADRVDAWRHQVCTAFMHYDVLGPFADDFTGEMRASAYGLIEANDVRSGPQRVRRTRRHVDGADADHVKLGMQVQGSCVVSQGGREAVLEPTDSVILDCARPVEFVFGEPFRQLVFIFPRQLLRLPNGALDNTIARRISGREGLGALVNSLLPTLAERCDEFPASVAQHVADGVLDLVTALCIEPAGTSPGDADPVRRSLVLQIKAFIEARLGDPRLTPDRIAAAHHISTRQLHRLFEPEGASVGRYVRNRRFDRCRHDLTDPRQMSTPISTIAARWGFTDPAHFSASYRSAFGLSPREQRAAALVPSAGSTTR
jgi:AraC-like DNA-binding protein